MHETPNIMIVDDNPDNLLLLARMLRVKGYDVEQYSDGAAALQAAAKSPPDLILLDIVMPEMDGFEVCRRLKVEDTLREIPVIFISALDDTANKVEAFSRGGVDYISKPFQVEEVLARVGSHLEILSLQRRLKAQNDILEQQVAKRTRELAMANVTLKKLDRLKNDFLRMLSHEIRTPANGVLGVGELIIQMAPSTAESQEYAEIFRESSRRLYNLIEDASMIADMENLAVKMSEELSFADLYDKLKKTFPRLRLSMDQQVDPAAVCLRGERALLKKALETVISLAACFSADGQAVLLQGMLEKEYFTLRIPLDALTITREEGQEFFNIDSTYRSLTPAEDLGLAPVAAHRIITACGGDLKLVKEKANNQGYLEVKMLTGDLTARAN